jgi:hypothetical protein
MGRRSKRYYTLMASLPALAPLFSEKQTPISRRRLEKRLMMLEPDDARELASMEDLMHWHRLPFDLTDREIVERAERVVPSIRSPRLREVAQWRIELRTVVAALRRRAAGEPAPPPTEKWGYGGWVRTIERHWAKSDFGLSSPLPWVEDLRQLVEQGDALGVERAVGSLVWQHLSRAAVGHYFDFEAVALYVLRWDVIHRWTGYDGQEARVRFDEMLDEGLGEYVRVFDA